MDERADGDAARDVAGRLADTADDIARTLDDVADARNEIADSVRGVDGESKRADARRARHFADAERAESGRLREQWGLEER